MEAMHIGDPCIHCATPHDAVDAGACPSGSGLAAHVRTLNYWKTLLAAHEESSARETKRLAGLATTEKVTIALLGAGFDGSKIAVAETIMSASQYAYGGDDRQSVLDDAVKWFADEKSVSGNLRREFFGTKNYDRWVGQRSDHTYGSGPTHGSACFSVSIRKPFRDRVFSDSEKDAIIYWLMNLPAIQKITAQTV
jgi:hypothetical protein